MYQSSHRPTYRQPLRSPGPQPPRRNRIRRRHAVVLLGAVGVAIIITGAFMARHHTTPKNDVPTAVSSQHTAADIDSADAPNTQNFNKKQYPTTDPASIWVVVNKQHPLNPKAYTPANLVVPDIPLRSNITSTEKYVRADMAKALEHMVNDAANQGVHFNLQSGYRSYAFQVTLYNGYVKSQGQSVADRQSARPGFSEHQTGLAADLGGTSQPACNVEACYSDTVEGKWLVAHSYQYGFIIRYPSDKEPVTGYLYEPWHIRYIGTELSQKLHADGIETLEEFFGVTGGTSY